MIVEGKCEFCGDVWLKMLGTALSLNFAQFNDNGKSKDKPLLNNGLSVPHSVHNIFIKYRFISDTE